MPAIRNGMMMEVSSKFKWTMTANVIVMNENKQRILGSKYRRNLPFNLNHAFSIFRKVALGCTTFKLSLGFVQVAPQVS